MLREVTNVGLVAQRVEIVMHLWQDMWWLITQTAEFWQTQNIEGLTSPLLWRVVDQDCVRLVPLSAWGMRTLHRRVLPDPRQAFVALYTSVIVCSIQTKAIAAPN